MIIDKIDNWRIYFKTPAFALVFEELKGYSVETSNAVYKTSDDFYFKVMEYETSEKPTVTESHRKEVDIQIVLRGAEKIKLYDRKNVAISKEYSETTDCTFYDVTGKPYTEVVLSEGYMAIFFPDDIHYPAFNADEQSQKIKKVVIKVNEKLFA